ncbi:MAG: hypothetical protein ACOC2O_02995 [Bacillota bacterium]
MKKDYRSKFSGRAEKFIQFLTQKQDQLLDRPNFTDHQKYVWPVVLALLAAGKDEDKISKATQLLNYGSYKGTWIEEEFGKKKEYNKEFFHFAGIGLTRLIMQFSDYLEPGMKKEILQAAMKSKDMIDPDQGTENHRNMQRSTAYILAQEAEKMDIKGAKQVRENAAQGIKKYTKSLFTMGQGEWDSEIYIAFGLVPYLNLYDFAQSPEIRELAGATLDWYTATYALKYFKGVYSGGADRGGSAVQTVVSHTDYFGYLWFDEAQKPLADFSPSQPAQAIHAVLSDYQPDDIIINLAQKNIELPVEVYASKPNYKMRKKGCLKETFYVDKNYTLGAVYDRITGWLNADNQQVMWRLTAQKDKGLAVTVNGSGMGYFHRSVTSGRDPWTQVASYQNTLIQMSWVPENGEQIVTDIHSMVKKYKEKGNFAAWEDVESRPGAYLSFPRETDTVEEDNNIYFIKLTDYVYLAVFTLAENIFWEEKEKKKRKVMVNQTEVDKIAGFVVEVGQAENYNDFQDFKNQVKKNASLQKENLSSGEVTYMNSSGEKLKMKYAKEGSYQICDQIVSGKGAGRLPDLWVNDLQLNLDLENKWPVYKSRYLAVDQGRLLVSDGQKGREIKINDDGVEYNNFSGCDLDMRTLIDFY